ncbi:hypothetical protein BDW75DRAFT_233999 [Aspergillus navahoensis]
MKVTRLILTSLSVLGALAAPSDSLNMRADRRSETVSGLGQRKQAILNAGGIYGDGKTYDAANFGLFKQNWGMLRVCASRYGFAGQSQGDWNNGALLKTSLTVLVLTSGPVASRWDCQNYYGLDVWFSGHRNGATGLSNPYTEDITNYKNAAYWIQQQIDSNSAYLSDDTRFWVDVIAI